MKISYTFPHGVEVVFSESLEDDYDPKTDADRAITGICRQCGHYFLDTIDSTGTLCSICSDEMVVEEKGAW